MTAIAARMRAMDDAYISAESELKSEITRKLLWLEQRLELLEHVVAFEHAHSPRGAMVQVLLLHREAEFLHGCADEDDYHAKEALARIERMLYSVAAFLVREFGVSEEELATRYMPTDLDPIAGTEAALEGSA